MVKKTVKNKVSSSNAWYALAVARLMLSFVFLWAFIDKLFGLGLATAAEKAWLNGGSPTTGFLKGVGKSSGPFADFFGSLAGQGWVDVLFMAGLLGIGLALLFGVALRLAAVSGALLLALMWLASQPLANNPLIDEHLVYIAVLVALPGVEQRWSLEKWWRAQSFIQNQRWLW